MWWGRGRCTALSDAVSARHLSWDIAQQLEVPLGQQSGSQWFPQQRVWWEVDCNFSQGPWGPGAVRPSDDLVAHVGPRAGSCRAEQSWLCLCHSCPLARPRTWSSSEQPPTIPTSVTYGRDSLHRLQSTKVSATGYMDTSNKQKLQPVSGSLFQFQKSVHLRSPVYP